MKIEIFKDNIPGTNEKRFYGVKVNGETILECLSEDELKKTTIEEMIDICKEDLELYNLDIQFFGGRGGGSGKGGKSGGSGGSGSSGGLKVGGNRAENEKILFDLKSGSTVEIKVEGNIHGINTLTYTKHSTERYGDHFKSKNIAGETFNTSVGGLADMITSGGNHVSGKIKSIKVTKAK